MSLRSVASNIFSSDLLFRKWLVDSPLVIKETSANGLIFVARPLFGVVKAYKGRVHGRVRGPDPFLVSIKLLKVIKFVLFQR